MTPAISEEHPVYTSIRRMALRNVRKSFLGTCGLLVLTNYMAKARMLRGDLGSDSGTIHTGCSTSESLRYIDGVFAEYRERAGVARFFGRVAEVGPGDSRGVALRFLEDGCVQVDLADRFWSKRDSVQQDLIERQIIDRSPVLQRLREQASGDEFPGMRRFFGDQASAEEFFVSNRDYDFIVSRAVLEHVRDPVLALRRQGDALSAGGMMLHAVDLRDHGMFSAHGFGSTKFLETPRWLHRAMSHHCGRPNRIPLGAYRRALNSSEFDISIKVTQLVGSKPLARPEEYQALPQDVRTRALAIVAQSRERLAPELAIESDADLSVAGFFLVARKRRAA